MSPIPELLPLDDYNAALLANVHPPKWQNPEPAPSYHLVVVGAGTAGLVAAAGAAGLGARVALVERHLMGGDCLNFGCVPSKSLIRSARAAAQVRRAPEYGLHLPGSVEVDFAEVMARLRRLRAHLSRHDAASRFQQLGVDVFLGEGRFVGPRALEVAGKTLAFKRAVIATGSRAALPHLPGLAEAGCLTNETVFSLTARPRRLAVLGGGPIGCELAQAFQRLGVEVTLLHRNDRLLNREDPEAAPILQETFVKEGMQLILGCQLQGVERQGAEKIIVYEHQGREGSLAVDEILVGLGRRPNLEGLNLDAAGVNYDRDGVLVNDYLQTSNPRIYAAGDVCLKYKFTHAADAAARLVLRNALFWGRQKLSALTIPYCIYTEPEVAHVGLKEKDAQDRGIPVQTFTRPLSEVDRAVVDGEEAGLVKVLLKAGTDKILGATIVAPHAGEMINEITLAMTARLGLGALARVIHPYPTRAEAVKQLADTYYRSRLTPFLQKLIRRRLAWMR